ncbi:hypothetical protein, partial [Escherichia coli]|uniref:hypothetical protein n=1 Tax=Escherichia coli TaxID=562 RepID=UPI001BFC3387
PTLRSLPHSQAADRQAVRRFGVEFEQEGAKGAEHREFAWSKARYSSKPVPIRSRMAIPSNTKRVRIDYPVLATRSGRH